MAHLLVKQLRFTRGEWARGLHNISPEDALRNCEPMNCLSWLIGHMAWHEQLYWLQRAQGITLVPEVEQYSNGEPRSTPPLDDVWNAWRIITAATESYLDTLTVDSLQTHLIANGQPAKDNVGTYLTRMIFHYWYHLGEAQAVRQLLGHQDLPTYIGDLSNQAPYEPEP
jgi:hypothetical protein